MKWYDYLPQIMFFCYFIPLVILSIINSEFYQGTLISVMNLFILLSVGIGIVILCFYLEEKREE